MSIYLTDEHGKLHKVAGAGYGEIDNELNKESTNPVQNKVIYNPVTFAESERLKSKNLFSSDISLGWYNGGSGRVPHSEVQGNTKLIDVIPNETYYFSTTSNTYVQDIVFYKDDLTNYISYKSINKAQFSFTVPSNANKIGFNLSPGEITGEMLTLGNQYEPYQPYGGGPITHSGDAPVVFAESERQKSKNLFSISVGDTKNNYYGLNINTDDESQIITIDGTSQRSSLALSQFNHYKLTANKTYTITVIPVSGSYVYGGFSVAYFWFAGVGYQTLPIDGNLHSVQFTPTIDTYLSDVNLDIASDNVYNNLKFRCQIEEGVLFTEWQYPYGAIVHEKEVADVEHVNVVYDTYHDKKIVNGVNYSGGIYMGRELPYNFRQDKKYKIFILLNGSLITTTETFFKDSGGIEFGATVKFTNENSVFLYGVINSVRMAISGAGYFNNNTGAITYIEDGSYSVVRIEEMNYDYSN